jgi:hypothetical protein
MMVESSSIRLRQIAIVVQNRDEVTQQLCDVFHVNVAYQDPALQSLGLHNSIVAIGDYFVEVVSPIRDNTTAERYRQRRGGDTGYMLIFQTNDHVRHRQIIDQEKVRVVAEFNATGFRNMQLHPADTKGVFIEIDQQDGVDAWHPAGELWKETVDASWVSGVMSVDVACDNPEAVAHRWSTLLDVPFSIGTNCGFHKLRLESETIRFVPSGPRGEGLDTVELSTRRRSEVVSRARALSLPHDDSSVVIGGVSFVLRDSSD